MDILLTLNNTVKRFLLYHTVNSISTIPPVVNSKEKKTDSLFTGMLLNVNITCGYTVQFPTKKFGVKNSGLHVLHANTCKTET